jgi:hypothetical protein
MQTGDPKANWFSMTMPLNQIDTFRASCGKLITKNACSPGNAANRYSAL